MIIVFCIALAALIGLLAGWGLACITIHNARSDIGIYNDDTHTVVKILTDELKQLRAERDRVTVTGTKGKL